MSFMEVPNILLIICGVNQKLVSKSILENVISVLCSTTVTTTGLRHLFWQS